MSVHTMSKHRGDSVPQGSAVRCAKPFAKSILSALIVAVALAIFLLAAIPSAFADPVDTDIAAANQSYSNVSWEAPPTLAAGADQIESSSQTLAEYLEALAIETSISIEELEEVFGVVQTAAGEDFSLALDADGTLWAWGSNEFGQLGLSDGLSRTIPTAVPMPSGVSSWEFIVAGYNHAFAIDQSGAMWAWGAGASGRLGLGTGYDDHSEPVLVTGAYIGSAPVQWSTAPGSISAGKNHTLAIATNGSLWAWGDGAEGKLGLGNLASHDMPQRVGNGYDWVSVAAGLNHSAGVRLQGAPETGGTLWTWGGNALGQHGEGNYGIGHNSTPRQVSAGANNWTSLAAGANHTIALRADGSLYAWGANGSGQLGTGSIVESINAPTRINLAGVSWESIRARGNHSYALDTEGNFWVWGSNEFGELGPELGAITSPRQLATDGIDWRSLSAGLYHSLAIDENGNLWSWGSNAAGQLGKGHVADAGTPEVANYTPWRIAATVAEVSPAAGATDIAVGEISVVVTFDRPMDTSIIGVITASNGATVNMASGTWSQGGTVFTVPVTLVEPGTVHTLTVSGFVDAQLGRAEHNEMHPYPKYPDVWSFRTEGDDEGPDPETDAIFYDGRSCGTCHFVENAMFEHQFVSSRGFATASGNEFDYGCQKCHFTNANGVTNWSRSSDAIEDRDCDIDVTSCAADVGCITCHGGPDAEIHGGQDRMLSAHTVNADGNGCSDCHNTDWASNESGFGFGVMDLASAHADYWIAADAGRIGTTPSAVFAPDSDDNSPFACGLCHSRIGTMDSPARLKPHVEALAQRGNVTCVDCHVAPDTSNPNWRVVHANQREMRPGVIAALDIAELPAGSRPTLSATSFFEGLSAFSRAQLNLGDSSGERLEPGVLAPNTLMSFTRGNADGVTP